MNIITLSKEKIYSGNLLLVNANFGLKNMAKKDLIAADARVPDIMLKRDAANVLQLIFEEISAGSSIIPVSGYRSLTEQTAIYNDSLKSNGEEYTHKFVALPNHSEHQTGLAIDLGLNKKDIDFICPDFPYEGICDKFRKIAPDYGFIERYPSKKEKITGISHEPWHFRYVGYPHSVIMKEKELTMEEYIEFVKQYRGEGEHLKTQKSGKTIEIFYKAADKAQETTIKLQDNAVYQVSGNNVDGFIVTLWRQ